MSERIKFCVVPQQPAASQQTRSLKHFACSYSTHSLIDCHLLQQYPSAYFDSEEMYCLAKAIADQKKTKFAVVPFDNLLEAEMLGCTIDYSVTAGAYVAKFPLQLNLLPWNFGCGRVTAVFTALEKLAAAGYLPVLNISGIATIINSLFPNSQGLVKLKDQQWLATVLSPIRTNLVRYIEQACCHQAQLISFSDPVADVSFLGEELLTEINRQFNYAFLQQLSQQSVKVHLCGKISAFLQYLDLGEVVECCCEQQLTYGQKIALILNQSGSVMLADNCWENLNTFQPLSVLKLRKCENCVN